MRVGEKETSEQAAIVARYADLFTRDAARGARAGRGARRDDRERERLYQAPATCEERHRRRGARRAKTHSRTPFLAARVVGTARAAAPIRPGAARDGTRVRRRDALGEASSRCPPAFNDERRTLLAAREALEADFPASRAGAPKRAGEAGPAPAVARRTGPRTSGNRRRFESMRRRWLERLLGPRA